MVPDTEKNSRVRIIEYTGNDMRKRKHSPTPNEVKYIQDTLYAVGGKWKLPILYCLSAGARRFSDLKEQLPSITPKMLSKELKELELNGFIKREDGDELIQYVIADYCKSFAKIISEMIAWGRQHRQIISQKSQE